MKLIYSPTSPYARKVRIVVLEKNLSARIDLTTANPLGADAALVANANPLGKVPALVLDDETVLYDSPVICEYLDGLSDAPRLFPQDGPARWSALRRQALGDGLMDAAFSLVMEGRRPEAMRAPDWIARWETAIARGARAAEADVQRGETGFDIGAIALVAALGYIDFRLARLDWRDGNDALARWFDACGDRASVKHTAPPAGA
ncbi:MAG: glutathione S-transferase N-terminal domain-containing protein [Hyphomonadaceae bacterium]|nr:glutathione S-transferase N-terminal domain-containing protein [Hyphomonadaceae bacterium]